MIKKKLNIANDNGYTLIEAMISVVVMATMMLGLTIVLLAFREQLDRSWAIRTMDQYGNDVIERLTHDLRNAVNVSVRGDRGNTHKIDIEYLDPYLHNETRTTFWRADPRSGRVLVNNASIDENFPPVSSGRGEYFEIVQFTLTPYGQDTPNVSERRDSFDRNADFLSATWDIRLKLRYVRRAINPGERDWVYNKEYYNRVYMRNMNLVIKDGITE